MSDKSARRENLCLHHRRVKRGGPASGASRDFSPPALFIAGGHRLEAAKRLGWEEIEAKIWTDVTDDWAAIMEIDDNLAGAEMNALDTAVFLATRKQVYERLHPETKAGVAGGLARQGSATELSSVGRIPSSTTSMK